mmetsp:Transcript_27414/g.81651  ORF Transcript_27414/g.81651 Transcript_27414/m.81651 type:complete len:407 (-) Transcript_27414:25-1245(-)
MMSLLARALVSGSLPPIYVQRNGGHSGSNWASELLATKGWSVYFQFGGLCDGKPDFGHPTPSHGKASAALTATWARGCGCGGARVFSCNAENQPRCKQNVPFCDRAKCPMAACRAGGGVAVVAAPLGEHVTSALDLAFTARPDARLVTWTRLNSVKHTLSQAKAGCSCVALTNHGTDEDREAGRNRPCFVHIPAELLLHKAARQTAKAAQFVSADVVGGVPVAHRLFYEEVRLDPAAAMKGLLRALNATPTRRQLAGPSIPTAIQKLTSDDLSSVLLDFAAADEAFGAWPCLRKHLHHRSDRVETCEAEAARMEAGAADAGRRRERVNELTLAAQTLAGNSSQPYTLACEPNSTRHGARHVLCAAAEHKRMALLGSAGPVDVCLTAGWHSSPVSHGADWIGGRVTG